MVDHVPGPMCTTRVGDDWIDDGTTCRARSPLPGPVGVDLDEAYFDLQHVYSKAPEAAHKRAIDRQGEDQICVALLARRTPSEKSYGAMPNF